jgi:hypothetical protein
LGDEYRKWRLPRRRNIECDCCAMGGGVAHVVQWQHRGEDAKWLAGASAWSWHQAGNTTTYLPLYLREVSSLGTHHINRTQSLAAVNSNIASFQPTPHTTTRSRHAHSTTLPHALALALALVPSIRYITRPTSHPFPGAVASKQPQLGR